MKRQFLDLFEERVVENMLTIINSIAGMINAIVLPLPVTASAATSLFESSKGIQAA